MAPVQVMDPVAFSFTKLESDSGKVLVQVPQRFWCVSHSMSVRFCGSRCQGQLLEGCTSSKANSGAGSSVVPARFRCNSHKYRLRKGSGAGGPMSSCRRVRRIQLGSGKSCRLRFQLRFRGRPQVLEGSGEVPEGWLAKLDLLLGGCVHLDK